MDIKISLPLLPLRDIVVFPSMVIPLFVGRDKSISALNEVMKKDKKIILVTQKNSEIDDPKKTDIFMYGCEGSILQLLKLPDGTVKVLVEGIKRVKILDFKDNDKFITCEYAHYNDVVTKDEDLYPLAVTALRRLEKLTSVNKKIANEEVAVVALWKVVAGKNTARTNGTNCFIQESLHFESALSVGSNLISTTTSSIGCEMISPMIEGDPMWVWAVICVKSVFVSAGVKAIHGTVSVLLWAFPGGFHIRNMKYPPLIVDIAIRTKGEVVAAGDVGARGGLCEGVRGRQVRRLPLHRTFPPWGRVCSLNEESAVVI